MEEVNIEHRTSNIECGRNPIPNRESSTAQRVVSGMNEESEPMQGSHETPASAEASEPTSHHAAESEADTFRRISGIRRQKALLRRGTRRDAMSGSGRSGGYQCVVWP